MLTFVAEIRTKGGSNNSEIEICALTEVQITFQNSKTLKTDFFRTALKLKHGNGKERQRCNNSYLQRKRKH